MIDFFAMDPNFYQRYMHTIKGIVKAHGIKHEGVLHNAIEALPSLWDKLSHIGENGISLTSEEAGEILAAYQKSDVVFSARFAQIFERSVGDPSLRAVLEFWLGGVHTTAFSITNAKDEVFDRLYRETEGQPYAVAAKAYDAIVTSGKELLTAIIDRCYNDLYK